MKHVVIKCMILCSILLSLFGCQSMNHRDELSPTTRNEIVLNGAYSTPEDVAMYITLFNELPANYITRKEARALGWESEKGNLWEVTDQKSIGGDAFGNREGKLPNEKGRKWFECDVNYYGGYRNEERIVFSNDGLIYYTNDHYETFEDITEIRRDE